MIEFRSVSELYNLIPNRDGPTNGMPWKPLTEEDRLKILSINYKKYIDVDKKLIKKYINQTVKLKDLIKELKNDLS